MTRSKGCQVCGEIETCLTVNVDESPTPLQQALRTVASFHCTLPGMGGFGLERCPACGAWFYKDWEQSMTGSLSNDYEHTYRLSPREALLLGLPESPDGPPPAYLEAVLERLCAGPTAGVSPFIVLTAMLQAIPRLEPVQAAAAAQALRSVASEDDEVRSLIVDAAKRFCADSKHLEIAALLAEYGR